MSSSVLALALAVGLALAGTAAWAWLAVGKVRSQLRGFDGFTGMHFEE